ncbi:hypothetical protein L7F22_000798 [Adiantum nelumboides]|nr:hypothetical protein [Adiantum nelumboides]
MLGPSPLSVGNWTCLILSIINISFHTFKLSLERHYNFILLDISFCPTIPLSFAQVEDTTPNAIVMFPVVFRAKDPGIWNEPSEFKPERSLEMKVDITDSKDMSMMLFGVGHRICPGLGLATMHMELLVARLVQMFEWYIWPPA